MGSLSSEVKKLSSFKACFKAIDAISPTDTADTDFWLSWYRTCLKDRLRFALTDRLIPKRFTSNGDKAFKKSMSKIVKDDGLVLKDIKLPLAEKSSDDGAIIFAITDSLLTYLLEGIEEETLYSMIPSIAEGPYEYKSVQLEEGDIVIDAGASIGEFSALAGIKGCKCYAFEPIPSIVDTYLSKTAQWNPNIIICQYALSNKRDNLMFDVMPTYLGSSSFVSKTKSNTQIKVEALDLDTFVEENKLPSVDFLKADIEGAERYMLMGAKRVLKEFAPKISICTYHFPDDPKVLRELILDANPEYIIEERFKKMYAYVPQK